MIRKMSRAGMFFCLAGTAAAELFVAGFNDNTIRRYDAADGSYLGSFTTEALNLPHELIFGPDNHLYVSDADSDRVLHFDAGTGELVQPFVAAGSGSNDYPVGLAFGPDGNLYVASQVNDRVLRYDGLTGAFLGIFVTNQSAGLDGPSGLAFGPDGNLYVAGRYSSRVYCYNGTNGAFIRYAASNNLSQPFGLAFGPDGNLYVASGNSNRIERFNRTNATWLGSFATTGLSLPIDLAFGPDTNLYVASFSGNRVVRFNGQTGAYIDDFVTAGSGGLNGPNFLVFRPPPAEPKPGALYFKVNNPSNMLDYARQLVIPTGFGENEFTMELWVRPDNTQPVGGVLDGGDPVLNWSTNDVPPHDGAFWWEADNFLLDGHNHNFGSFRDGSFTLQFYGGGRLRWLFGDGTSAGPGQCRAVQVWPATNTPSLLDGAWHHVACVRRWEGVSEARLELWIDGRLLAATNSSFRTEMQFSYWSNWAAFPVGQEGWCWGEQKQAVQDPENFLRPDFKGMLDDVTFWSHAKSPETLSNAWHQPVVGTETGLVGWLQFREGTGSVVRDAIHPARFLALSNNLAWTRQNAPHDTDANGVPQWWDALYGSNAVADVDGDGQRGPAEYEAGTSPTNAGDSFRILSVTTNKVMIWTSVGGRSYRVEHGSVLTGAFTAIVRPWSNETEQGVGLDQPSTETYAFPAGVTSKFLRVRRLVVPYQP